MISKYFTGLLKAVNGILELAIAGTDYLTPTGNGSGLTGISDATINTSDITTNDVSITKHGFAPKAPNDTTKFLRGDATWVAPTSAAFGTSVAKSVDTIYTAATDGFVTSRYTNATGAAGGVYGYTDAETDPATILVQSITNSGGVSEYGSICMPVKSGNKWKVVKNGTVTAVEIYWHPLG